MEEATCRLALWIPGGSCNWKLKPNYNPQCWHSVVSANIALRKHQIQLVWEWVAIWSVKSRSWISEWAPSICLNSMGIMELSSMHAVLILCCLFCPWSFSALKTLRRAHVWANTFLFFFFTNSPSTGVSFLMLGSPWRLWFSLEDIVVLVDLSVSKITISPASILVFNLSIPGCYC